MALQLKSFGKHRRQSPGTPLYLKYPVTFQTSEMVMMVFSGEFVARRFPWKLD